MIAVIAAISVIAYTGIQNRANDTAVQSNIRNLTGKVREIQAIDGKLPVGNFSSGIAGINRFTVTHNSYLTSTRNNFYYCRGVVGGVDVFGIVAASSSGKIIGYRSDNGSLSVIDGTWGDEWTSSSICPLVGIVPATAANFSFAWGMQFGAWFNWTK